jgi:hypothetical protein
VADPSTGDLSPTDSSPADCSPANYSIRKRDNKNGHQAELVPSEASSRSHADTKLPDVTDMQKKLRAEVEAIIELETLFVDAFRYSCPAKRSIRDESRRDSWIDSNTAVESLWWDAVKRRRTTEGLDEDVPLHPKVMETVRAL